MNEYEKTYQRLVGKRESVKERLQSSAKKLKTLKRQATRIDQAQTIVQEVAIRTQEQLKFHLTALVTTALHSTFPDPYSFEIVFDLKRNRTDASLFFERDGELFNPMDSAGGGAVDIASFALRLVLWSLRNPRRRPVLILDEPFRFLNDHTRELHRKAAFMLKEIGKRLGMQTIVVSQLPELAEAADKVFDISRENGISVVNGQTKKRGRRKKK